MNNKNIFSISFILLVTLATQSSVNAHDTTHIHPLITDKISDLIDESDKTNNAYKEIYEPDTDKEPVVGMDQRLYWGTDFDAGKTLSQDDLMDDQQTPYNSYETVIDGAVQEDIPSIKVLDHFYHALSGNPLNVPIIAEENSAVRAMRFFNESVGRMGGYTEDAKHTAFFEFGQALHHVEDMSSPAHIHNDTENVLSAPTEQKGSGLAFCLISMLASLHVKTTKNRICRSAISCHLTR
ncbi:MAG: hypothetical protein OEY89_13685 [Gammaproteobacteria bacterium]|nr:hypothetical protein [Gammaproteobacteria bacterium]